MTRFLILAFVLFVTINAWECPVVEESVAEPKLYQGQQLFSINFLKAAVKRNPSKSVFFSPHSIYQTLLLTYMGSNGTTEENLKTGLHLNWSQNQSEVLKEYRQEKSLRMQNAKKESVLEMELANKFYFDQTVELRDCIKTIFKEEIEFLDIHNKPEDARKHINAWVEQTTRNNIKDLLPVGSVDEITKLAIANAAYFKGEWINKFDPERTKKDEFYKTPTEKVLVDMMIQSEQFNLDIHNNVGISVLEMPYNSTHGDISFIAVLPQKETENALNDVIEKITPEVFAQIVTKDSTIKVAVHLPKFTFEQTTELSSVLKDMGLSHIFAPETDFSGFSETTKISFSGAFHKAKIEVDEGGTKAASGTAFLEFISAPLPFIANRPFFYMIYDHKTQIVLFAGVYKGPEDPVN